MVFFSVLLGTGIGAAAVIALIGNKPANDAQVSGLSSASVISEEPTNVALGNEGKDHTNKSDGAKARAYALDRSYRPKGFWDWSR
jgi:hypothetical protein